MAPPKKVTQYTYNVTELAEPETGHTKLLPSDEKNHVIEMDPLYDPELRWAGKARNKSVPILPLQRNEIVTESRIAQIIERVSQAAKETSTQSPLTSFFQLEKALREKERPRRVEFYKHEEQWKNKLICGDSLLVMESLLHYEGLRGKVQMIYFDPPYGIKYDSNFQQRVDSTKNLEEDKADDVLTITAFRDTWALGIHSYLSHLQERLYLCRELLTPTGSIFVQIGDENVHLVRALMDEVFGKANYCGMITFKKTVGQTSQLLASVSDSLLWYSKDRQSVKFHPLYRKRRWNEESNAYPYLEMPDGTVGRLKPGDIVPRGAKRFGPGNVTSQSGSENSRFGYLYGGKTYYPQGSRGWSTSRTGLDKLALKKRLLGIGNTLVYRRYIDDFPLVRLTCLWDDTVQSTFSVNKTYKVQTAPLVVERCIAMTTDPGDLVFDPTCGSGTTGLCAEKLGRRWVTCDTSRVGLNVARQSLLSGVYQHYRTVNGGPSSGFLYNSLSRVSLKSLANDLEPEKVPLFDKPLTDDTAIRVAGPFEVMTIGRYSLDDWKGYVHQGEKLENYIDVICHLYRKDAAVQGAAGLVHAIAESENLKIAISVGPLSGRVTAKQISDAVEDAIASGVNEIHVLGWAFEANVGEIISRIESRGKIKVNPVMIRPDTLVEGLKVTAQEGLFSPYALPDIEVRQKATMFTITLNGVAVFDRKTRATDYKAVDSGYISAWYLDEDYDGDCFVDCQMFFNSPQLNLDKAAQTKVPKENLKLQNESRPFSLRGYGRVAVKVVDVFGNESTVVRDLSTQSM